MDNSAAASAWEAGGVPVVGAPRSGVPFDGGLDRVRRSDTMVPPVCKVAMVGTYSPRRCGIATFTTDLLEAVAVARPQLSCFALAMNDPGKQCAYPENVRFEIPEGDLRSYRRAAAFLNVSAVDVVSLQHEYGIFGGEAGSHILALLGELRMPIVTTLHTILSEPTSPQRVVMEELVRLSERFVVMSVGGAEILRDQFEVPAGMIDLIPHGIPVLPQARSSKERIGLKGNHLICTFGLLSPDKGIEYVISALPAILEEYPDAMYIVVGATHPHIKDREGETYRLMLEARARRLGVESNIIFHNKFVSTAELTMYLSAADVYVTPYLKAEQITSGTLAYAVGSGKAVISTPYLYARELLAEGRGSLVPWRDSTAIAQAAIDLFGDDEKRLEMCLRAASYGRGMAWPAVGRSYLRCFDRARTGSVNRRLGGLRAKKTPAVQSGGNPATNFDHMKLMTDGCGMLQHAAFCVPRYEDGYCLDDNARALIVTTRAEDTGTTDPGCVRSLASRYLAFVRYAWNPKLGRFRNFMSYERRWQGDCGSEDSHGRALWALGTVVGRSSDPGRCSLCRDLFHSALPAVSAFTSPRAWAFALLGIEEYLRARQGDTKVQAVREGLSERLLDLFHCVSDAKWTWFEDRLTYCNARLPQALIVSGARMQREDMLESGLRSLRWLVSLQRSPDGYFAPVGSDGFYVKGGPMARFDQQPVEASATLSACLDARRVTNDNRWMASGRRAFNWFLGENELKRALYDATTGGCRDGLEEDRLNENQGAESTLAFLLAALEMQAADLITDAEAASLPQNSMMPRFKRGVSSNGESQIGSEKTRKVVYDG